MSEKPFVTRFRAIISMSREEIVSRRNAWAELQAAGRELLHQFDNLARKQSSPEMSSLASRVMSGRHKPSPEEIRRMAASILSQDEVRGQSLPELEDTPESRSERALADAQRNRQAHSSAISGAPRPHEIEEAQPVPGVYGPDQLRTEGNDSA